MGRSCFKLTESELRSDGQARGLSYKALLKEYAPDSTSNTAEPASLFTNFTPFTSAGFLPDSVTAAASLAGTQTVAVVFAGTVMSSVNCPLSRFQELFSAPYIVLCVPLTNVRSPAGYGRMMACRKPGFSGSARIPARYSYIHTARSPICITWLPEFIAGSAVLPFHSSHTVVAPCSTM